MALIKKLNDLTPKFGKHCYFSEGAAIIGDVTMGDDCTVWFNAVLRGDVHFIKIGNRVNIQDGSCLHTLYGKAPIIIGGGELWGGVPARFIKKVDPEQAKELNVGYAQHYVMYSDWYRRSDAHPEHTHYCTTSEEYDEATRR